MHPWPVRMLRWLTAPYPGQPSRIPLALAILGLSLTATVGQALAYPHSDTTDEFARGIAVILAINVLVGLTVSLSANPVPVLLEQDGPEVDVSLHGIIRVWAFIGLSMAVQVIVGVPLTIALGTGEWTTVFSPLLFGAVLPLLAQLLAWLAGWLVLWPIILLARALWMLVTRRRADAAVTAACILILTLAGFAVTTALGTDFTERGERGGIRAIYRLWADQSGDPLTLSFRWVARALLVLALLEVGLMVAAARARSAARRR